MAIDSENKRRGTAGAGIPGIAPIVPDGSVSDDDRAFLSGSYPFDGGPGPSMIKCVKFFTRTKLSGADCRNAPFILCVSPGLVATPTCEVTDEAQDFTWSTINAALKEAATCEWVCDAVKGVRYQVWKYQFLYNTSSLASGVTALGTKDILGAFHKGCMAKWVEELVGNEPYIETEDGSSVFVSPHGCRYPIIGGDSVYAESKNDILIEVGAQTSNFTTQTLSIPFSNPFTDADLIIIGGYNLTFFTGTLASSPGVTVVANINNDESVIIRSAAASTSFVSDTVVCAGFVDGLAGSVVPAGGSMSFDINAEVTVPAGDEVSSYTLRAYLTAIKKN